MPIPIFQSLLTESFLSLDDEHKLAYLLRLNYPESSDSFLEQIFGLTTGSIEEALRAHG